MKRPIIYTDLDGSLLDHYTYEATPAKSLLRQLDNLGTPVIPCTSKTVAEVIPLCRSLNLFGPFIAENGALICVPTNWPIPIPKNSACPRRWLRSWASCSATKPAIAPAVYTWPMGVTPQAR